MIKDSNENSALMETARNGSIEIAKYFINNCKLDPNERNGSYETTILLRATRFGWLKYIKYLIEEC